MQVTNPVLTRLGNDHTKLREALNVHREIQGLGKKCTADTDSCGWGA